MKNALRQQAQHAREQLSVEDRIYKSVQIVERLLPFLEAKQTIGIYIAMSDEVDVGSLLFVYDKVGAPKVRNSEVMDFFLIEGSEDLEKGVLGILEPKTNIIVDPMDFDAIVVPLVGFDEHNNRIGHGKGYYDRYLAQSNALKIGVAFDVQNVETFTPSASDVVLDVIITESRIYRNN